MYVILLQVVEEVVDDVVDEEAPGALTAFDSLMGKLKIILSSYQVLDSTCMYNSSLQTYYDMHITTYNTIYTILPTQLTLTHTCSCVQHLNTPKLFRHLKL